MNNSQRVLLLLLLFAFAGTADAASDSVKEEIWHLASLTVPYACLFGALAMPVGAFNGYPFGGPKNAAWKHCIGITGSAVASFTPIVLGMPVLQAMNLCGMNRYAAGWSAAFVAAHAGLAASVLGRVTEISFGATGFSFADYETALTNTLGNFAAPACQALAKALLCVLQQNLGQQRNIQRREALASIRLARSEIEEDVIDEIQNGNFANADAISRSLYLARMAEEGRLVALRVPK